MQKAEKEIILIDGYTDVSTLNIPAKKNPGVNVTIITFPAPPHSRIPALTNNDIAMFNSQYPSLPVKYLRTVHDRFLILGRKILYHVGASLKDAGKKCFAVSLLDDPKVLTDLLARV